MQRQKLSSPLSRQGQTTPHVRAHNCLHLSSGDTVGAVIEYAQNFEDTAVVFASGTTLTHTRPSDWVGEKILDVAAMCETIDYTERPLVMPVPAMVLTDPFIVEACIKAAAQTRLCHQEISLELTDAAITLHTEDAHTFVHMLRRKGFRVSVDARKSWAGNLPGTDWLMVDTLRIRAQDLDTNPELDHLIETAAAAGVAIIAEQPYWRDGDYLATLGIDYAINPRTDS